MSSSIARGMSTPRRALTTRVTKSRPSLSFLLETNARMAACIRALVPLGGGAPSSASRADTGPDDGGASSSKNSRARMRDGRGAAVVGAGHERCGGWGEADGRASGAEGGGGEARPCGHETRPRGHEARPRGRGPHARGGEARGRGREARGRGGEARGRGGEARGRGGEARGRGGEARGRGREARGRGREARGRGGGARGRGGEARGRRGEARGRGVSDRTSFTHRCRVARHAPGHGAKLRSHGKKSRPAGSCFMVAGVELHPTGATRAPRHQSGLPLPRTPGDGRPRIMSLTNRYALVGAAMTTAAGAACGSSSNTPPGPCSAGTVDQDRCLRGRRRIGPRRGRRRWCRYLDGRQCSA